MAMSPYTEAKIRTNRRSLFASSGASRLMRQMAIAEKLLIKRAAPNITFRITFIIRDKVGRFLNEGEHGTWNR